MSLIKNTAYYSIGSILPKIGAFIFLPIYLKYLTPAEYGIITSLQVLNAVLIILFTLSLPRALYRLYYDYKTENEQKRLIGTVLISVISIALFSLILILLFRNQVSQIYKSIDFYPYFFYAVLSVFFLAFLTIPQVLLQIKEKAVTFVSLNVSFFFFKSTLVLVYIMVLKEGALGYLKAEVISDVIFIPIYYLTIRKSIKFSFNYTMLRSLLVFSLPIIPGILSAWVLNLSDRIFLERYFSTSDVGIYSLGYQIAGLVLLFTTAFKSAYDPYFYKIANTKTREEASVILYKTNHVFLVILILSTFVISFFSKEAIVIFFNSTYYPAIQIVPLVSLGYLFSQNSALLNVMVYQEKKTKVIMYLTIISAITNIGLNFLLIPVLGIIGAAITTVLSYGVLFILTYNYAKKYYFIPFNWGQLLPILISCIILSLGFYFLDISNIFLSLGIKILVSFTILLFFALKYKSQIFQIFNFKK